MHMPWKIFMTTLTFSSTLSLFFSWRRMAIFWLLMCIHNYYQGNCLSALGYSHAPCASSVGGIDERGKQSRSEGREKRKRGRDIRRRWGRRGREYNCVIDACSTFGIILNAHAVNNLHQLCLPLGLMQKKL